MDEQPIDCRSCKHHRAPDVFTDAAWCAWYSGLKGRRIGIADEADANLCPHYDYHSVTRWEKTDG